MLLVERGVIRRIPEHILVINPLFKNTPRSPNVHLLEVRESRLSLCLKVNAKFAEDQLIAF